MTTLRVSICGIAGLFFVGCATTPLDETGTVDSGSEPSDTDADTDSEDSGGGDTGTPTQGDTRTLSGTIQWTVDFDAEAEALGFTDCAYTREYAGIEDKSQPWLCPECAVVYRVDATVIDGLDDCFSQIATDPSPTEWLGWTAEGVFRRSGRENYLMSDQGSAAVSTDSVMTQHAITLDLPDGGQFAFDIQGAFVRAIGDGDVFHGYTPPNEYACGWPKSGAPEFTGAYALRQGQALPDAVMMDRCEEPVRLHDFSGQYLVIDISAVNCPPCRSMAQQEPEFAQKNEGRWVRY